jgi:hypothetical protein
MDFALEMRKPVDDLIEVFDLESMGDHALCYGINFGDLILDDAALHGEEHFLEIAGNVWDEVLFELRSARRAPLGLKPALA